MTRPNPSFRLFVSHRQLAVFLENLERPFCDWTEAHTKQGFVWRPGSVSFSTLVDSGSALVEVEVARRLSTQRLRRQYHVVPFTVEESRGVEVSAVSGGVALDLASGHYKLVCQQWLAGEQLNVRLSFLSEDSDLECPYACLLDGSSIHGSKITLGGVPA